MYQILFWQGSKEKQRFWGTKQYIKANGWQEARSDRQINEKWNMFAMMEERNLKITSYTCIKYKGSLTLALFLLFKKHPRQPNPEYKLLQTFMKIISVYIWWKRYMRPNMGHTHQAGMLDASGLHYQTCIMNSCMGDVNLWGAIDFQFHGR